MKFHLTLLLASLFFTGCFSKSFKLEKVEKSEKPQEQARLYHVVLCWLKEPGNEMHRKQIIEITKTFQKIPGVIEAQAGEVVMSDRDIVEDSYDVGILIVTKNENELQKYLDHPIHQKAKKDVLVPMVDKILVYDFKN
jgi:NAD(P)H-hydrate repair Nnr-like enzyme with NAD(P)H-hydrate dehydratase domain